MKAEVFFEKEAEDDLASLYALIATAAGERAAGRFVGRIRDVCQNLADFPRRGRSRDDLGAGIRTIPVSGRAVVSYEIEGSAVYIVHIFYAGRDYGPEDFRN